MSGATNDKYVVGFLVASVIILLVFGMKGLIMIGLVSIFGVMIFAEGNVVTNRNRYNRYNYNQPRAEPDAFDFARVAKKLIS
jgi:hypothetical protein